MREETATHEVARPPSLDESLILCRCSRTGPVSLPLCARVSSAQCAIWVFRGGGCSTSFKQRPAQQDLTANAATNRNPPTKFPDPVPASIPRVAFSHTAVPVTRIPIRFQSATCMYIRDRHA